MDSFKHVSESELDLGLDFAEDKHGIRLNRDVLRILYNDIGKKLLEKKGKYTFIQAKREVLDEQLEQRTKEQRLRFIAYSCAISKIANQRSQFATRQRKATARRALRAKNPVAAHLFWRGNQLAFI